MTEKAIQDHYPESTSHCFGCGYSNASGLGLKSYWNGGAARAEFLPPAYYTAIPGYVYGGLIASLIDCHATATAAAAKAQAQGGDLDSDPLPRFVTASLKVTYLKPTPEGIPLQLTGKAREIGERKVIVDVTLAANEETCATGEVVAVVMPQGMIDRQ